MDSGDRCSERTKGRSERRRFLQLVGATGAAGVAGCADLLGDDSDDPHFEVRDLEPADAETVTGESVQVSVTVENTGDAEGEQTVEYRVDDEERASQSLPLDAGEEEVVSFENDAADLEAGEYAFGVHSDDDEETGTLTVVERVLTFNPYEDVDWETVEPFKNQIHVHTRDAYDEVADLIRTYTGEGPDPEGQYLADGDEYAFPNPSYGTGPDCHYWPWENFSDCDAWSEDFDPAEHGVVGYPIVEIDDVWHTNVLFNYGRPNDVSDDHDAYGDWEEAVDVLLEDTEFTVVDDEPETPYVMPSHPARYYVEPEADGLESYRGPFEKHGLEDGLIGIECLTKAWGGGRRHMEERNAKRWDNVILAGLLTDLEDRDGPCLVFGADDPNSYSIGRDMDRRWTSVLLEPDEYDPDDQAGTRRAVYEAMGAGRVFACQRILWNHPDDSPPQVPTINAVEVDEVARTITVDADGGQVYWANAHVAEGGRIGDYLESAVHVGETFDYDEHREVVEDSHIFPHVVSDDFHVETLLQPFTF